MQVVERSIGDDGGGGDRQWEGQVQSRHPQLAATAAGNKPQQQRHSTTATPM
jgi:hypothetical protein